MALGEGVPRSAPLWIPASAGMTWEGAGIGGCGGGAWGGGCRSPGFAQAGFPAPGSRLSPGWRRGVGRRQLQLGEGLPGPGAPLDSCLRRNDVTGGGYDDGVWGGSGPLPGLRSGGLPRPWIPAFAGMEAGELGDGNCNLGRGCPAPAPLWIPASAGMTREGEWAVAGTVFGVRVSRSPGFPKAGFPAPGSRLSPGWRRGSWETAIAIGGGVAPLRAPLDSCLRRNDGRGRE